MPLGTLDRTPPPFFKQGPSAVSKLLVFSALALFLMVADTRFKITQPLRVAVSTVLFPLQWLALQPVRALDAGADYLVGLHNALSKSSSLEKQLALQFQRSAKVEQLELENRQLRELLKLQQAPVTQGVAAEILYDAPDPFTRRVIIDKGQLSGIAPGSPVVGALGVIGQVTRVHAVYSEVTLLIDRDQTIPVLNARTGERTVAYGDAGPHGHTLELRFMAGNADVQKGDLLTTSGVDGVYPAGLHVARIDRIERRADSAFAKIYCEPIALMGGPRHVMVLQPVSSQLPERPVEPAAPSVPRKGARKSGGHG